MGTTKDVICNVERLTYGPKHHLFGFHDLKISNHTGDKYLALEADIINRPPLPGELFGVGYVKDGQFVKVGNTTAMNYPQGARQQWVADSEYFTVNNRIGDVWGTDLYDSRTNQLLDRYEATAHMLTKDGRYALGLDYARLYRLGVYGYTGLEDKGSAVAIPDDTGITITDMNTKETKLLVSVRDAAFCGMKKPPSAMHHYLTHLCLNPSSTRVAFLHRYNFPGGGMIDRLLTIGIDGTELRCLGQGYLSHYDWKDDNHIYIYGRTNSAIDSIQNSKLLSNPIMASPLLVKPLRLTRNMVKLILGAKNGNKFGKSFIMISDEEDAKVTPFAQDIIPQDGHPMTNPTNNDWCILDTYPNKEKMRDLFLYTFQQNTRINIGKFHEPIMDIDMTLIGEYFKGMDQQVIDTVKPDLLTFYRTGLHCDLHPRWSSDGKYACFDSLHDGTRQIYRCDVSSIIDL